MLCNNAGVGGGGLIADQQLVDWRWVIDVNIYGVVHGIHHFLPHLRASGEQGHIVNTASVAGLYAGQGLGPYNASKFAVVAISRDPASRAGRGRPEVGVSVLCPGNVATNIATSQRNRPEHLRRQRKAPVPAADAATTSEAARTDARRRNDAVAAAVAAGMAPSELAQQVVDAIRARRFWILTHPEYLPMVKERNDSIQDLRNP